MVTQLMQAMKSGGLDPNAPGMAQIKNLLSLQQQQQKSGQVAGNPAAAVLQAQAQGSGSGSGSAGGGTDQLLMAAMRQQMLQQGQGQSQGNQGQQQQQQRPQVQPQPQAQQPQNQGQRPNQTQNQVWSGNLVWTINATSRRKLPHQYMANESISIVERNRGRRIPIIRLQR